MEFLSMFVETAIGGQCRTEVMNRSHIEFLSSPQWARMLETDLLPWIEAAGELGDDVLEIGPGPGLTTDLLRTRVARVTAIEIDPVLADPLKQRLEGTNVEVICGDAAETNLDSDRFLRGYIVLGAASHPFGRRARQALRGDRPGLTTKRDLHRSRFLGYRSHPRRHTKTTSSHRWTPTPLVSDCTKPDLPSPASREATTNSGSWRRRTLRKPQPEADPVRSREGDIHAEARGNLPVETTYRETVLDELTYPGNCFFVGSEVLRCELVPVYPICPIREFSPEGSLYWHNPSLSPFPGPVPSRPGALLVLGGVGDPGQVLHRPLEHFGRNDRPRPP